MRKSPVIFVVVDCRRSSTTYLLGYFRMFSNPLQDAGLFDGYDKTNQSLVKFLEGKNDTSIRILLGDFNAYNKNQIEGSNKLCENAELINNLISKDCRTEFGEQEKKLYFFCKWNLEKVRSYFY